MALLETPRLELRRLTVDDAPFMLGLLNEPSFIQFIGDRGVRTIEEAQTYISLGPMASYARFGFGLYLVELKSPRTPIGICGILKREELPEPDIGFAFRPAFWSQGYAWEAASAVKATPATRSACRGCSRSSVRRTRARSGCSRSSGSPSPR